MSVIREILIDHTSNKNKKPLTLEQKLTLRSFPNSLK